MVFGTLPEHMAFKLFFCMFLDMDGAAWSRHGAFSAPHLCMHFVFVKASINMFIGAIVLPPMTSPTLFPLGVLWCSGHGQIGGEGGGADYLGQGVGGGRRRPPKHHLKFCMCQNDHVEHHAF